MPLKTARNHGFTLIEVLVALAIMSLMAMMAWRGVDAIMRTRDISQAKLEQTMRLQTVLAQWEQDLQAVQDVGTIPALRFDGATLRLTRWRPAGVQVVAWSLRDGAWLRWESAVSSNFNELLASYQYSLQLQDKSPGVVRAVEGVNAWQLYFYRGNAWSNALSSDDVAASPASAASSAAASPPLTGVALPSGVKFTMQFAQESDWTGTLSRSIALGVQP
jgi:general secretion pathway protein J